MMEENYENTLMPVLVKAAHEQLKQYEVKYFETEADNGLLFVYAESKCPGSTTSKRYHKMVLSTGPSLLVMHSSNIIDSTYCFSIKAVKQEFIIYANYLSQKAKNLHID